jgi:NAD(P)H dehydrogenase (quinone)
MSKVLVLFDSHSGRTAKLAALIAEGAGEVPRTEVRVRRVDDPSAKDDVLWCDGMAVGSPTNMGVLSWKMKRFWDETMADAWMKIDGKIGCAFSSSGGRGGGAEIACQSILTVLMNFGLLVFGVTDYATTLGTAHYGAAILREPREDEDKAVCRLLGRRLAEWCAVFADGRRDQHPLVKPGVRLGPG